MEMPETDNAWIPIMNLDAMKNPGVSYAPLTLPMRYVKFFEDGWRFELEICFWSKLEESMLRFRIMIKDPQKLPAIPTDATFIIRNRHSSFVMCRTEITF
jgi:hypothetical protein